jgi:hypothetical protein
MKGTSCKNVELTDEEMNSDARELRVARVRFMPQTATICGEVSLLLFIENFRRRRKLISQKPYEPRKISRGVYGEALP